MAIESITARVFTTASDVWAFGITLYEIGTIGKDKLYFCRMPMQSIFMSPDLKLKEKAPIFE